VSDALIAAKRLGRPLVVATSIPAGPDRIGALAVDKDGAWFASTSRLENAPRGAGDLFAALFLAARLRGDALDASLRRATAATFHVLSESVSASSAEMLLIQALTIPMDGLDSSATVDVAAA
jgi:pyridoxine kinase